MSPVGSEYPAGGETLPDGVLVAFYGDDFTGSSAVMEVLTFAGLPAVMFLEAPTAQQLARFEGYRAIGIAGTARAQSPEWMSENLPKAFAALEALRAPVTHYKICSTFDSSPQTGSIGVAMEIGAGVFGKRQGAAPWQPILVAAPEIRRYQAFGNLFASYEGVGYRLDRHPVMARHPVTPMREADIRLHLAAQTTRKIGLIDFVQLKQGLAGRALDEAVGRGDEFIALDTLDDESLAAAGRLVWERRCNGIFVAGSQGVEYALVAHWRQIGALPDTAGTWLVPAVKQVIAASGSVAPTTAAQIAWAAENGFEILQIDAARAVDEASWHAELDAAVSRAGACVERGNSPLLTTAIGPDDPAVESYRTALSAAGISASDGNSRIGRGLGEAVAQLVERTGIRRIVISGGDTSGFATMALGAFALTALAPIAPGVALCRLHSDNPKLDGVEIALKGGQMGARDLFGRVRAGSAPQQEEYAK